MISQQLMRFTTKLAAQTSGLGNYVHQNLLMRNKSNVQTLDGPPGSDGIFMKIVEYIKENDDEQVTISKLVEIMKEKGGESFCSKYMRQKLEQYFGDQILITDSIERHSVVTLRETAASILYEFQQRPKDQDSDSEKLSIIKTAANLLKSEMKSVETNRDAYPSSSNMSSLEYNLNIYQNH